MTNTKNKLKETKAAVNILFATEKAHKNQLFQNI